jgi:hypothetical protein
MKKTDKDNIHLCPSCNCVEMVFVERIASNKYYRLRRFKCPVCDHTEMYIMNGPNDKEKTYKQIERNKYTKFLDTELNNPYKSFYK